MAELAADEEANRTDDTVLHTQNLTELEPQQEEVPVLAKSRKTSLAKFTIYVTNHRMYIVGSNFRETVFRIMEIDMENSTERLEVMEDNVYFKRNEIIDVLNELEESSEGGLTKKITSLGLLGFIKFTKCFYLVCVTKKRAVAELGSHYIYHIEGTEMIPVTHNYKKPDRNSDEARYIQTFLNIDLNKTFYYSDSYDITNTLQTNMMRQKTQSLGINSIPTVKQNERFVWNKALLEPILNFDRLYDWFQPIIYGFIDQVKISILDTEVYVTLIGRRSHHFAGARFFKRGANESGDVANEVETEQIVANMLTSSFHDPEAGFYNNPRYSSFVQHRGSIPLCWSQSTAPNLNIKPPIEIDMSDPYFTKAALHFDDMFKRYGAPVQILNLIKQREKSPRETKLLTEFNECIRYLNQFLPDESKLDYTAWDMSSASKGRGQDVIEWLEKYSESSVSKTGIFLNGKSLMETKLQQGICRTNCVDCLDRTNTAQFVIGKRALGHQLKALGIITENYLEYDSDVTNILTEMFHDHGDTIALQYAGSHLVNTLQTYRKINQWSSHSRDIIESVKRFYSNSMVDSQKQDAMNLFLGIHKYQEGKPKLWELNTDYYLHNSGLKKPVNNSISYTHWFTDNHLKNTYQIIMNKWNDIRQVKYSPFLIDLQDRGLIYLKIDAYNGFFENYWNLKYPAKELTSLNELFEFNMNSTSNYSRNITSTKRSTNQNTAQSSSVKKKSDIFSIFKIFDTGKQKLDMQPSLSRNDTDMSSVSNRVFGQSSTTSDPPDFYAESIQFGLEEDGYFSPFKSRKPHRALKIQIAKDLENSSKKVVPVDDNNDERVLLRNIKQAIHDNEKFDEHLNHHGLINEWNDDVIAFETLQVDHKFQTDLKFEDLVQLCKMNVFKYDSDLPVIDPKLIEKVETGAKSNHDPIKLHNRAISFSKNEAEEDSIHENGYDLHRKNQILKLYQSLDKQYTSHKPTVKERDFKIYQDFSEYRFLEVATVPIKSDIEKMDNFKIPDTIVPVDTEHKSFDEADLNKTVIYTNNDPIITFRRTQSASSQRNGLIEIRNKWKRKRRAAAELEGFNEMDEEQAIESDYDDDDYNDQTSEISCVTSSHSNLEHEDLVQVYDRLLNPEISDIDMDIYKSYVSGAFDFQEKQTQDDNDIDNSIVTPLLLPKIPNEVPAAAKSQSTGAVKSNNKKMEPYKFYKFNAGLRKKLSQINIRGV